jgi:glutathione S-transferase
MARMITVHHLEHSRSQRILWLLEELGLPYEVKRYPRDAKTSLAPPELRAVHPLGKSPVLSDGDIVVAESGAIIEYLVDKCGGALKPPPGTPEQRRWTYWLHFAEGSAMPFMVMVLVFERIKRAKMPFFAKPIAKGIAAKVLSSFVMPNITRQFNHIEAELAQHRWFAGEEFSAADIQMCFVLEAAASRKALSAASHPRMVAFLQHCHARPAYQRALERGGPYELLHD